MQEENITEDMAFYIKIRIYINDICIIYWTFIVVAVIDDYATYNYGDGQSFGLFAWYSTVPVSVWTAKELLNNNLQWSNLDNPLCKPLFGSRIVTVIIAWFLRNRKEITWTKL